MATASLDVLVVAEIDQGIEVGDAFENYVAAASAIARAVRREDEEIRASQTRSRRSSMGWARLGAATPQKDECRRCKGLAAATRAFGPHITDTWSRRERPLQVGSGAREDE